jgi:hypothetical protein
MVTSAIVRDVVYHRRQGAIMRHQISVVRDRFGWWRASFCDAPHETYGGMTPRAALKSLVSCNPQRRILASRLISLPPESSAHLRFTLKSAPLVPSTSAESIYRR